MSQSQAVNPGMDGPMASSQRMPSALEWMAQLLRKILASHGDEDDAWKMARRLSRGVDVLDEAVEAQMTDLITVLESPDDSQEHHVA